MRFDAPQNERHIEDEVKEMMAEGRRRVREYEQMQPITNEGGKVVGFLGGRKQPERSEAAQSWGAGVVITTYTPTEGDLEGLAEECEDLNRDADLMKKYFEVDYGE